MAVVIHFMWWLVRLLDFACRYLIQSARDVKTVQWARDCKNSPVTPFYPFFLSFSCKTLLIIFFFLHFTWIKNPQPVTGFTFFLSSKMATALSISAGNCGKERPCIELGSYASIVKDVFGENLIRSCKFRRGNGYRCKGVRVIARAKKWKKHEYPWPDNIDPNITSGHLSYLSHFKPSTEKPKPVTLPFEKPLIDLEKRIIEASQLFFFVIFSVILLSRQYSSLCFLQVRGMADETGLDFSDQISTLENKYQQVNLAITYNL